MKTKKSFKFIHLRHLKHHIIQLFTAGYLHKAKARCGKELPSYNFKKDGILFFFLKQNIYENK